MTIFQVIPAFHIAKHCHPAPVAYGKDARSAPTQEPTWCKWGDGDYDVLYEGRVLLPAGSWHRMERALLVSYRTRPPGIVQNTSSWNCDMVKTSGAAFAFMLVWSTSATAIETPAASLYRALTDLCLDRYLGDKDLNAAQLNTGRPLIVHCDCMARFLFSSMDAEAICQLETRVPDKITSNWDDAAQRCSTLVLR